MGINIEITLSTIMCDCGALYAVPHWVTRPFYVCPFCSQRKQRELNKEIDGLYEKISHHVRVIVGLRGALKRKRG